MRAQEADRARLAALRSAAQLLHRPAGVRHPADVAAAIAGAQAQDLAAGRLAFRARARGVDAAAVDRARTEERSIVRTWAMRGTLHLLAADDAGWVAALFAPALIADSRRRLAELGADARTQERGLAEVERSLAADGPLDRTDLVERLRRRSVVVDERSRFHLFRLAVALGIACLGPDRGGRTQLVLARDWLAAPRRVERETALRELARRYLGAFGPASEADFAGWSGLGRRDVRAAVRALSDETIETRVAGHPAWRLRGAARRPRSPVVRLLPAWDTYLMGYRDRGFLAAPDRWRRIMPGGGVLRPVVTVDGVAVATWRSRRSPARLRVEVRPLAGLAAETRAALEAEAADVGRFEGREAEMSVVETAGA